MADKTKLRRQRGKRTLTQAIALILGNAWLPGFLQGTVYQGPLKSVCLPGLNCYSCPGALGACPIGSLQNAFADPIQRLTLYVIGLLALFGGLFGRFICGWLCPFGLFQEILHRIRSPKWHPDYKNPLNRRLSYGKVVVLALMVLALPAAGSLLRGMGEPAFCKWICPSGTLMAGLPLLLANRQLRELAGWIFGWKTAVLIAVAGCSIAVFRPFCRYICPLGAIYGFFNRISLYRVTVDPVRCNHCGICTRHCPMSVSVPDDPNRSACIRCGECAVVCPQEAIRVGFQINNKKGISPERRSL